MQARHRCHQADRIGVLGVFKDLGHGAAFDHLTAIHHRHGIGDFGHHTQIMGDHDRAHPGIALQVADQIEDLRLNGHIKCGCRFIRDQKAGVIGQRHGDHDALALTT